MKKTQRIVESFSDHSRKLNENQEEFPEDKKSVIDDYLEDFMLHGNPPNGIYNFLNMKHGTFSTNRYGELVCEFEEVLLDDEPEDLGIFGILIKNIYLSGSISVNERDEKAVIDLKVIYELMSGGRNGIEVRIKTLDGGKTWRTN